MLKAEWATFLSDIRWLANCWPMRKLVHLWNLAWHAITIVVANILDAMLIGIWTVTCGATIWELWTPAKAMADQAMVYLMLAVGRS